MSTADPIAAFAAASFGRLHTPGEPSPWTNTSAEGLAAVRSHVQGTYGVDVDELTELDAGVLRAGLGDGRTWVVRVFAAARPVEAVAGDAEVLRFLAEQGFPAERCAAEPAVTELEGRGVLVTDYVEGAPPTGADTMRRIGDLLGRLHAIALPADGAVTRPAGSWHHVSHAGGPRSADAAVLRPLLDVARTRVPASAHALVDSLAAELDAVDDGEDLPQAIVHIDLGGPNVIETADGTLVGIDWAGAGRGARIASLAALMGSGGDRTAVRAFVDGYRAHVELEPAELDRLAGAIRAHSLILDCWTMVFAPALAGQVAAGMYGTRQQADAVAALVRDAYQMR